MENWVAIMIPCFNGTPFLNVLMNCLINQTYNKLHIIIVDDGSTDQSGNMIMEYKQQIEEQGKKLTYIRQDNKGLASAINTALSQVNEEFLTWMDVDDRISINHVERMVKTLNLNPEYKWVSCKGFVYSEKDLCIKNGELGIRKFDEKRYAEDLLFHRVNCSPGLYMLKTEAFQIANKGMSIYCEGRIQGQNMQMLLPMAFMYGKPYYLDEFLFHYTVRESSLSHSDGDNIFHMMNYVEHIHNIKTEVVKMNGYITLAYKNTLMKKLKFFNIKWKLEFLCKSSTEDSSVFIKEIFDEYLNNSVIKDRCIRIWGVYPMGIWLQDVLKNLYPQYQFGYIESDKNKCSDLVKYKDEIDVNEDYVISLLQLHTEIEELLCKRSFNRIKDYLYFQKEIDCE